MSATNKLSIYLIKEGITEPTAILTNTNNKIIIEGIGDFYFGYSFPTTPSWVESFFLNKMTDKEKLKTSSAKGVLLIKIVEDGKEIFFVLSFGMGRHMVNKEVIEERFGLITALNTISTKSIRSIEKNNIAALSKLSKEQMSKDSEVNEFGIDIEQDLVRAVTGKSKSLAFGNIITGADSFSLSVKRDIENIKEFLVECYKQYQKKDYQEEFGWIDQIEEIKNPQKKESLDNLLIDKLNVKDIQNIWMAVPDLIEWSDIKGFKYLLRQKDYLDDLSLELFLDDRDTNFEDIKQLQSKTVKAYSATTDEVTAHWSVYKCIYGEISEQDGLYVINNGKWYLVNTDFVSKVNKFYDSIELSDLDLPEYAHKNEGDYSKNFVQNNGSFLCLDADNISYGGGHSKIEFCDLFSNDGKIIHLKRYGGSSVLSHLFFQGVVSGELFVSDPEFRVDLNRKLEGQWKLIDPQSKPNATDYEIIYGIISNVDDDRPHIPFFSKVSIKNATRRLVSYGYTVKLKRISVAKQTHNEHD